MSVTHKICQTTQRTGTHKHSKCLLQNTEPGFLSLLTDLFPFQHNNGKQRKSEEQIHSKFHLLYTCVSEQNFSAKSVLQQELDFTSTEHLKLLLHTDKVYTESLRMQFCYQVLTEVQFQLVLTMKIIVLFLFKIKQKQLSPTEKNTFPNSQILTKIMLFIHTVNCEFFLLADF